MPDDVLEKIRYLCRVISRVEWSGILLYQTEGSIQKPETMVITLKDIIPMHKGDTAYTEYNFNEKKRDQSGYTDRHIDYTNENEEALSWQIGHIHSHNNMNVFFSPTDMAELNDNSPNHNFYLSLIVNNRLDFMAKISFVATARAKTKTNYMALDEDGNEYNVGDTVLTFQKEKLFIYDCAIESNKANVQPDNLFEKNVSEILEIADTPKYAAPKTVPGNSPSYHKPVAGFKGGVPAYGKGVSTNVPPVTRSFFDDIPEVEDKEEYETVSPDIEYFGIHLLNGTNPPDKDMTFEDALNQLKTFKIAGVDLANSIVTNYTAVFNNVYDSEDDIDVVFIEVTEELIELFEIYEDSYRFLTPSIMSLKGMLDKYIEYQEEQEENVNSTVQ